MSCLSGFLETSLNLVSLTGCGVLFVAGFAVSLMGVMGLVSGMHGGPLVAAAITLFGGALPFLGGYFGRLIYRSIRRNGKIED